MSERRVVTVSRLVRYLKGQLEGNAYLHSLYVEGEISNLRRPYSGHWYFSLKDEQSSLPCVMFASAARNVKFPVNNGDKVIVRGDITVYQPEGRMQLLVQAMQPGGTGALYLQLEALKKKLFEEGLFDEAHKKPLPQFPMNIALVTGNNTAARSDVLITLQKRWPVATVHEYPCPVQGEGAALKIVEALQKADAGQHDVILLVRGGGSLEDLWCFNDELLARTVYALHTPVVTGVGHETDTTLVDFVSDHRANTPTGAVEAAVPDIHEVRKHINDLALRMGNALSVTLKHKRMAFERLSGSPAFHNPETLYRDKVMRLDFIREKLLHATVVSQRNKLVLNGLRNRLVTMAIKESNVLKNETNVKRNALVYYTEQAIAGSRTRLEQDKEAILRNIRYILDDKRRGLEKQMRLLDAYSPLKVLDRGYSIVTKDDKAVIDANELKENDLVTLRFAKGSAQATIQQIKQEAEHGKDQKENI